MVATDTIQDLQARARRIRPKHGTRYAGEHQIHARVAAMTAQVVGSKHPVPMGAVGMRDRYAESGRWKELMERYGLTAEAIVTEAKAVLARKSDGRGPS